MKRTTQRELARRMSAFEAKWLVKGEHHHRAGDHLRAAKCYNKIIDRNPRCWAAVFNAAVLAHQNCEHDWAIHHLQRAVTALPGFAEAWYNLGTMLQSVARFAEAAEALQKAVDLGPEMMGAKVNLGNALLGLGRTEEAHRWYEAALGQKPNSPEATWNLAHYLILTGDWIRGWKCYEARWHIAGFVELNGITVAEDRTDVPRPWPDGAPIWGRSLIVAEEQGYGDLFMTLRYAPTLRAMGATVTWAVRPECMRLVMATVYPDRVVNIREPVPGADYIVTCMSLLQRLGATPENIPGADGYLMRAA